MDDLALARQAAAAAAAVIRSHADRPRHAHFKGDVNPVTAADREAERALVDTILRHHPGDGVLAEEGTDADSSTGRRWVIDPLDGTVNFLHGVPHVAVSVALEDNDGPVVAVVVDVFRDEEFTAVRGEGAHRNDARISTSTATRLGDALVSTGFSYDRRERAAEYGDAIGAVLPHVRGIRRMGSAALDLAWVACGRYDGHWERRLGPWDIAAGVLLVGEAGGIATAPDGGPPTHHALIAAAPGIHEQLRLVAAAAWGEISSGAGPS